MNDVSASIGMPQVRRRVIGSNVWLLSFGDLVTLLLGFFVAIIASAMQNPPKDAPPIAGGTPLAKIEQEVAQDGTREFHQVLKLPAESFNVRTGELVDKAVNQLKSQLNLKGVLVNNVLVQGCVEHTEGGTEQARFTEIGRLLATASQLVDAGIAQQVMQIETPSAVCGAEGDSENGFGSVVISVAGRIHG